MRRYGKTRLVIVIPVWARQTHRSGVFEACLCPIVRWGGGWGSWGVPDKQAEEKTEDASSCTERGRREETCLRALLQAREENRCLLTAAAPRYSVYPGWYETLASTKPLRMLRRGSEGRAGAGAEGVRCKLWPQKLPKQQWHELAISVQMAVHLTPRRLGPRLLFRLFPITGLSCPALSWTGPSLLFTTACATVPQSRPGRFSRW